MRFAFRKNVEGEHDEFGFLADNDECVSVEGGVLTFSLVTPAMNFFSLIEVGLILVGIDDHALQVASINFSLNDDSGVVMLAIAEETDIRDVSDEVKTEKDFGVGKCLSVFFFCGFNDCFSHGGVAKFFDIGMKIPLGIGRNIPGGKFSRAQGGGGEEDEKE